MTCPTNGSESQFSSSSRFGFVGKSSLSLIDGKKGCVEGAACSSSRLCSSTIASASIVVWAIASSARILAWGMRRIRLLSPSML